MTSTHTAARPGTTGGPSSGRLLSIYLRHHEAASRGGVALFRRSSRSQLSPQARRSLAALTQEVAADRAALLAVLDRLDVRRPRLQELLVAGAEMLGRLKPNGTLLRRSPLSDVVELEALSTAVEAKRLGWVTLKELSQAGGSAGGPGRRLDEDEFDRLIRRADEQRDRIETLRRQAVREKLGDCG